MELFLGAVILLFGGGFFARGVARARESAWAGPRTSGMRQRAGSRSGGSGAGHRPLRHEIRLLREKVRLDDWLEQQRHERRNGAAPPAAGGSAPAVTGTVLTPLKRAHHAAQQRAGGLRQAFTPSRPASSNGSTPAAPAAPSRAAGAPTPAPTPNGSPGRNTTVAATASGSAVEQMVEGVNQIHAHAQAGGLHAKQGGVKASHEGAVRFAAMAAMLARAMSEPGQNYGPEITEPIARAGTHLQAAAMSFSEADAALASLANMTVGDLATSSRQAPHHTELSENGSR